MPIHWDICQRISNWFGNMARQGHNLSYIPAGLRGVLHLTATKTKLMPWQAYSKLVHNDKGEGSLASQTDAAYYQYMQGITPEIKEKMQARGEKVKS